MTSRDNAAFPAASCVGLGAGEKWTIQGHDDSVRRLTNPEIHDTLIELSKLDGAFVVRGDGYIQSAAVFLVTGDVETQLPYGLGSRHIAAASVTAHAASTAIVVSATDGNVRAFANGQMVLQLDPEVPYSPAAPDSGE